MRNLSRCFPAAALCFAAVFAGPRASSKQPAAQSQTIETEPRKEAPAPTTPIQLKTLPVRSAAPPTAEELSHIVAYYVASSHTLHIRNADHFLQGIRTGKFLAAWSEGARTAQIRGADGSLLGAQVIADKPNDIPPAPKEADVKYIEMAEIASHAEEKGNCYQSASKGEKEIGNRLVYRQYSNLVNSGKDSGTETWSEVARYYHYDVKDCSAGYSGNTTGESTWALTVGPWPNP